MLRNSRPVVKRLLDLTLCLLSLPVTLPLMGIGFLLVRLSSPGPVFFLQWRAGLEGRPFRLFKLRTMYTNAPDLRNPDGSAFTGEPDPRVTPIGRYLRKTSLDELPQLLNVLCGHMSLVGPRPDQVDQLRYYTERERRKLAVKPGITGLAQISGRNRIPWKRRKELDLEYVNRQSLLLDLNILLKTAPYVLRRKDTHSHAGQSNPGSVASN